MIRHGRYHDERQAEDGDPKDRETLRYGLAFVVLIGLVCLVLYLSPNARW